MMLIILQLIILSINLVSSDTTKTNEKKSSFDEHSSNIEEYRVAYPHPEDYVIELLVNPCGVNSTQVDSDKTIPLGYDCCMNRFGRGEFGFLKYVPNLKNDKIGTGGEADEQELSYVEIFQKRIPAGPDEVLHNMVIVDEKGVEIPYEYSRRADDHTAIDESCIGLRDPHPLCLTNRLRAFKSPYVPACWDHNQTVDSTISCYTPEGEKKPNCMQVSYSQNAFIHICGGEFSNDPNCGTYIEIHRSNGSPYDSESTTLSQTKINTRETNGMSTTTIDLTYKGNPNRILCAYNETKIRLGSMVRITQNSPQCCCPPRYNKLSKHGSFFCPRKKGTEGGPYADTKDLLAEQLENDKDQLVYPYCHDMDENEDMLMCSREIGSNGKNLDLNINVVEMLIGSENSLFYTDKCPTIRKNGNERFSSIDLHGEYESECPFGDALESCGGSIEHHSDSCVGADSVFDFRNRVGKITKLPKNDKDKVYGVTFNDGRTEYYFPKSSLELQEPHSNYELWFVQRNRFEKIFQKKKGFRVIWPECTFDPVNDRYFPFAETTEKGESVKVLIL